MDIQRFFSTLLSLIALLAVFTAGAAPTLYTDEQRYLDALALTAYETVHEGFEEGEWKNVRSPILSSSVTKSGVTWAVPGSSDPARGLTTGIGDFHDGVYEMYTLDLSRWPLVSHVMPDGYTLTTAFKLYAVGGWFRSPDGAKLSFTLDGRTVLDFAGTDATVTNWKFLGFIEPDGFNCLEIRTSDEIIEPRIFFSDDFSLAVDPEAFALNGSLQFSPSNAGHPENGQSVDYSTTRIDVIDGQVNAD